MAVSITSTDYIYINGVKSDTVGLYIDTPSPPQMAVRRGNETDIGSEQDSTEIEEGYDDIPVDISAYIFKPENFNSTAVYAYFNDARTLQTSRFPDFYYRVRRISSFKTSQKADGKRLKYAVSFLCEPFKYLNSGSSEQTLSSVICNLGTVFSRPIYKFSASGTVKINCNGTELTVYVGDSQKNVVVDCEEMVVYDSDSKSFVKNSGYFPLLPTGNLDISTEGSVSNMKIIPNWRCI